MASLSLYRRVLGAGFDELPEVLKRFHDGARGAARGGRFGSCVGTGLVRNTVADLLRHAQGRGERADPAGSRGRRRSRAVAPPLPGAVHRATVQWADGNLLMERFGLTSFSSALVVRGLARAL